MCDDVKVTNLNDDKENPDTVVITGLFALEKAIQKIAGNKPIVFDEAKKQALFLCEKACDILVSNNINSDILLGIVSEISKGIKRCS